MTKNKVEHAIPVSARLAESLGAYYRSRFLGDFINVEAFAFSSGDKDLAITTRQVERIICAAGWKALGRPVHPHILRHTAASRWMRVTNEAVVQKLLGHKYLTSTQIYCHPNSDDLRQAIDKATVQPGHVLSSEQRVQKETELPEVQRPGPVPASQLTSQDPSQW